MYNILYGWSQSGVTKLSVVCEQKRPLYGHDSVYSAPEMGSEPQSYHLCGTVYRGRAFNAGS
jgi:hypothetical protein